MPLLPQVPLADDSACQGGVLVLKQEERPKKYCKIQRSKIGQRKKTQRRTRARVCV
jgi:hypothetical protein